MDWKTFKELDMVTQKYYLLEVFKGVKDTYPIYKKIYTLLLNTQDLSSDLLYKIYNGIKRVWEQNEEKKQNKIKQKLHTMHIIEQKEISNDLLEIENYFI